MSRVSSRIGASTLEPLAQVDDWHGAALVRQHPFEESGGLGQRRGRLVSEDALDLKDVERELLAAARGRSPAGCRRQSAHAAEASEIRAPSAARSSNGTNPPSGGATRGGPWQSGSRPSRADPGRSRTDSASSTSRQTASRRRGPRARRCRSARPADRAVEQRAQVHQRQDPAPRPRVTPRTEGSTRRHRKHRARVAHLDAPGPSGSPTSARPARTSR